MALALVLLTTGALGVSGASAASSVYVANSGDNTISQFGQQPGGQLTALTPASVPTLGEPGALVASPDDRDLYATIEAEESRSGLEQFSIAADGTLQPLAPAEISLGGRPTSVAIGPDGRYVYVTDFEGRGAVAQFAVGPGGALAPLSPASVPVEGASEIALAPNGRYAYVVDGEEEGAVWQFEVAPDGTLHALSPASIQEVGFKPHGISISPDGRNVYVVDGREDLKQFAVTANGTLAELSPASVPTAGYPVSVGWSSGGGGLLVPELEEEEPQGVEVWRGVVQSFERRTDGTLSLEASTPAPSGELPWGVAVSADGRDVYVTNEFSFGANGLWQLGLDPAGELAPLTPAFADTGESPRAIAIATQPSPSTEPPTGTNPPAGTTQPSSGSTQAGSAQPPVASASAAAPTANAVASPQKRTRDGETFAFDATLSVDPGGRIVSYRWTLDGRVIATTPRFSRFFSSADRAYRLTLTVSNESGVSASTVVTVSPRARRAPVVHVTIPATATFCLNCAQPLPAIATLVRGLRRYARGARLVSIASYADATGSRAYNMALTRRRSQAIARLLLADLSPAPHKVAMSWYGESDPVASNATPAGRARNRRSVIRIER